MIRILILTLCVTLSSCFVGKDLRKKRKADKLVKKAQKLSPELFKTDTIIYYDTIIVENHVTDTITKLEFHDTTTVINNDRLVVKYFYDTLRQEIYHEAECKADTIRLEEKIPVTKYVGLSWWDKLQLNAVPLLLLFVGFIFLIRKRNNYI